MKLVVALVVALIATISVGMALDAKAPAWLESMGPGESYTYGDYYTKRAAVGENAPFVPESLNSKLTFVSDGVSASVDQTVATSLTGTPEGIYRQLLEQSASAFVYEKDSLPIDAENDATATTLVMNIVKDQNALFSGKVVSEIDSVVTKGYDAPFDGTGNPGDAKNRWGDIGFDDDYGGHHQLAWLSLVGSPAAFTTTFSDDATLTANANTADAVTLRQTVDAAKVTVSANALSDTAIPNVVEIIDPACRGYGDLWTLNPDGSSTFIKKGHLDPGEWEGSAQLTEAAASMSSDVTLTDKEVMILGNICNFRTMDGSAGLEGAFANAITSENSKMNIDFDGDMNFWWT